MTSLRGVISYPIPAYSNLPIEPQFYKPRRFVISNITLGQSTIITTTENMDYVVAQQVRLLVPSSFGSYQLNEKTGYVLSIIAPNQVEVDINSLRNVDPFISSTAATKPEIIAIGDINSGVTNLGRTNNTTYIPGSFINISPV